MAPEDQSIRVYAPRSNIFVFPFMGVLFLSLAGVAFVFANHQLAAYVLSVCCIVGGFWFLSLPWWKLIHTPTLVIDSEGIRRSHPFSRWEVKWGSAYPILLGVRQACSDGKRTMYVSASTGGRAQEETRAPPVRLAGASPRRVYGEALRVTSQCQQRWCSRRQRRGDRALGIDHHRLPPLNQWKAAERGRVPARYASSRGPLAPAWPPRSTGWPGWW